jgi:pullulanase
MKAFLTSDDTIDVILSSPLMNHDLPSLRLRRDYHHLESCTVMNSTTLQSLTQLTLKTQVPLRLGHAYELIIESFGSTPIDVSKAIDFPSFDDLYSYPGDDLGSTYHRDGTIFKLWAPLASNVNLKLKLANGTKLFYEMERQDYGVYHVYVPQDIEKASYLYEITNNGVTQLVIDPYGKGSTRNSLASVVVNFDALKIPMHDEALPPFNYYTESIIYEAHVRDLTADPTTSIQHKGRFLGMVEKGISYKGYSVGYDYLTSLGFTHLQLLPVQDYRSVDEFHVETSYNWGYDPYQYFALEGSYASNLDDPYSRIQDFLTVVSSYHQAGIRINIDVVYNHVFEFQHSVFEKVVPGYYFRKHADGTMSNGSFCGNDLNTTRPMVRKLIVESAEFLVRTYHLDGFRFDLMGIIDRETMDLLTQRVKALRPDFMLYGEGWDMPTALPVFDKSRTENHRLLPTLAFFNDQYRNTIKGGNFEGDLLEKGYLMGKPIPHHELTFLLTGSSNASLSHPKVSFPYQSINYVECHDNGVFFDKLIKIFPSITLQDIQSYTILSLAVVMFSLGIPFFHMGQETASSKEGHHNSYNAGDRYNMMRYEAVSTHAVIVEAFKALTHLRKKLKPLLHPFKADSIHYHYHHDHVVEIRLPMQKPVSIYFNPSTFEQSIPSIQAKFLFNGRTSQSKKVQTSIISPLTCWVVEHI